MNTRHSSRISQEHHQQQISGSTSPVPSHSNSFHTNLHDQAFILSSDQELINSSYDSSLALSHLSSNLSKKSSFSSIDQIKHKNKNDNLLACLSHHNEDSSINQMHLSEYSDSQISLIKGLEPLFQGKNAFTRRSPRFANAVGVAENTSKISQKQRGFSKNQSDSEMIEDQKPSFTSSNHQNHNSSKIIEENHENSPNLFQVLSNPLSQSGEGSKPYESSLFARTTRSSKKIINEEAEIELNDDTNILPSLTNKGKESVSKMTKDFIIETRKNKKIKKMRQQTFQFGLKSQGSKSFKRGYG